MASGIVKFKFRWGGGGGRSAGGKVMVQASPNREERLTTGDPVVIGVSDPRELGNNIKSVFPNPHPTGLKRVRTLNAVSFSNERKSSRE